MSSDPLDTFKHQLDNQLRFIRRSCEAFDTGDHQEGVRIATSARVLFHHTNKSHSVIALLGAPPVRLISCVRPEAHMPWYYEALLSFSNPPGTAYAPLHDKPFWVALPLADWWNQTVTVHNGRPITRRQIVLFSANKDGGAHVDPDVETEYQKVFGDSGYVEDPMEGIHNLTAMRQIGHEIINSPELFQLANLPFENFPSIAEPPRP